MTVFNTAGKKMRSFTVQRHCQPAIIVAEYQRIKIIRISVTVKLQCYVRMMEKSLKDSWQGGNCC